MPTRCAWVPPNDELYVAYHDLEWGLPLHDERALFELLCLEGAQAGLSWRTILARRDGYRAVFDGFDPESLAAWGDDRIAAALADSRIVRNRLKVNAVRDGARALLRLHAAGTTLDRTLWAIVGGSPIQNRWQTLAEIPVSTPAAEQLSRSLKRLGFRFVGPTICYAFMEAAGLVNDHTTDCFRYRDVAVDARQQESPGPPRRESAALVRYTPGMTIEAKPAAATNAAPAAHLPAKPRAFSGIQPSGVTHLGNDLGAVRNFVALQNRGVAEGFETIYCIVDYHALTSTHNADVLRRRTLEMAASLIALGLDPDKCTLFVQSHRPEVTELCWLFNTVTPVGWLQRTPTYKEKRQNQPEDVNHGLLTYPVLQAADIAIYKASLVPVGKDQAAHLELSREVVRAFNARYGETFPEPQAVYTTAPVVLGTDGVRKMSKSVGNTIEILAEPDTIRKQVMSMVTDTTRILRSDPGHPERCNVCQTHRFFGDDYEEIWEGERTSRTGCVDTKKLLAARIIEHYAEAREKYNELIADPARLNRILEAGAEKARPIVEATMDEVREKMGLR